MVPPTLSPHRPHFVIADYYMLCKPNVVGLMLITALVGMLLATPAGNWPNWWLLFTANLGIGLCASAAAVVNQLVERRYDAQMERTQARPLPTARISPQHATYFAIFLSLSGSGLLLYVANLLTMLLTLFSMVGYAVVYTLFLKRSTPQNIVLGGLAGATPPLLGWTAITGTIDAHALLLVIIIFLWTPPHFWSLALARKEEYERAGFPMLPVSYGDPFTRLHILLYTLALFAASLLPYATTMLGQLYLVMALILSSIFLWKAFILWKEPQRVDPIGVFWWSIIYLFVLFIAMLIDHQLRLF